MIYQKILEEYHLLQSKILEIRKKIALLPEGKLTCARGNNCYKWYNTIDHALVNKFWTRNSKNYSIIL